MNKEEHEIYYPQTLIAHMLKVMEEELESRKEKPKRSIEALEALKFD